MNLEAKIMLKLLKNAKKAAKKGEIPVSALVVNNNKIISSSFNKREKLKDITAHAEILAIKKANKKLNAWMLDNATLYVTLEPCAMCAGAIIQSRIKRVVYAASEPKFGSFGSIIDLSDSIYKFNHKVEITKGILEMNLHCY